MVDSRGTYVACTASIPINYNCSLLSGLHDFAERPIRAGVGKSLVDDVYKLEELNDRFPELLHKLCAPSIKPSHVNPSKHVHYSA